MKVPQWLIQRIMSGSCSQHSQKKQITGAFKSTCDTVASKKFMGLTESSGILVAHEVNNGWALQDVLTANTIASSRVEGMNVLIKKFCTDVSSTLFLFLKSLESFVESQEVNDYIVKRNGITLKQGVP